MYLDNDPGVLISACLFGDGAGAAVLSRAAGHGGPAHRVEGQHVADRRRPERDALMFEQRDGMLRNILTREVPALAAEHAQRVLDTVLGGPACARADISAWIMHAGGRDVLLALRAPASSLQPHDLRYSAAMLREYGNLSSAFVYFVLAGGAGRRGARRLVVAVVVRRRLQLPRRLAARCDAPA